MIEYLGASAEEFVTLVMIKCWEKPIAVKQEKITETKPIDLLPNVTEAETKPKEEAKPKKEAEKIVDPKLRCPLFDPMVTKMGISNKGHRQRKNVI